MKELNFLQRNIALLKYYNIVIFIDGYFNHHSHIPHNHLLLCTFLYLI